MSETVVISLLRGVNLAAHNRIKMDALRALYTSLDLRDPQSYIQSGNVLFRTKERNLASLARRIEEAIERKFDIRSAVILRTAKELRATIAANIFFGKSAFGSTPFVMNEISSAAPIMCISIRSSTS